MNDEPKISVAVAGDDNVSASPANIHFPRKPILSPEVIQVLEKQWHDAELYRLSNTEGNIASGGILPATIVGAKPIYDQTGALNGVEIDFLAHLNKHEEEHILDTFDARPDLITPHHIFNVLHHTFSSDVEDLLGTKVLIAVAFELWPITPGERNAPCEPTPQPYRICQRVTLVVLHPTYRIRPIECYP